MRSRSKLDSQGEPQATGGAPERTWGLRGGAGSRCRGWGPCRKQTHTSPAFVEFIPQAEGVRPQIHKNSISLRLCRSALNTWFWITDFSFHWLLSLWSTGS